MIQVKYTTLPLFLDKQSLVVINEWKSTPEFSVSETNNKVILTTARLKIVVSLLLRYQKTLRLNN